MLKLKELASTEELVKAHIKMGGTEYARYRCKLHDGSELRIAYGKEPIGKQQSRIVHITLTVAIPTMEPYRQPNKDEAFQALQALIRHRMLRGQVELPRLYEDARSKHSNFVHYYELQ